VTITLVEELDSVIATTTVCFIDELARGTAELGDCGDADCRGTSRSLMVYECIVNIACTLSYLGTAVMSRATAIHSKGWGMTQVYSI